MHPESEPGTELVQALRAVPLFSGLDEERLHWISSLGEVTEHPAGATIAAQGDPPDGFYVILSGQTEWSRNVGGREVHAVTLGENDIFAELIMVLDEPYPTTGRATTGVRLFGLGREAFWEMLGASPEITRIILATSVERSQIHETVSQSQAKLISLGTMAAGLAHELNNPAAAARRSVSEARKVFENALSKAVELGSLQLVPEERELIAGLPGEAARKAEAAPRGDPLESSDIEDEIAVWLEERGVDDAWEVASTLASAGLDAEWLEGLATRLPGGETLAAVVSWLAAQIQGDELLREVEESVGRSSELVKAIKSYSHMDRAPLGEVDVHEGIESTLTMLGHKLKKGKVELVRDYDEALPRVCGHPGELNQVWTNLLDNAIDAVAGEGSIRVRTAAEESRILVEISDSGPGIPEEIRDRIYEPFFSTKDVGEGTGIGLDISRRLVVENHGGDLRAESEPGRTSFQVRLPLRSKAKDTEDTGAGA